MKYIKSYKIFESTSPSDEEIKAEVEKVGGPYQFFQKLLRGKIEDEKFKSANYEKLKSLYPQSIKELDKASDEYAQENDPDYYNR